MPIPQAVRRRRAVLAATASETKAALPAILHQLPHLQPSVSQKLDLHQVPELKDADCPKFKLSSDPDFCGTSIKVLNEDTLDAALIMAESLALPQAASESGSESQLPATNRNQSVAVLNLASDKTPGGGWLTGAVAQEEALCYRSSLSLSLHESYYPWASLTGIYTRHVVVIRSSMASGHRLLSPQIPVARLPVVSVISVAGIRKPEVRKVYKGLGPSLREKLVFKYPADRNLTKARMRMVLRIAAGEKHELLVLGALGCGAFKNPPEEIAQCWLEVLQESEFEGGWWREIWFAVFDRRDEGNFGVFDRVLGGKEVGKG